MFDDVLDAWRAYQADMRPETRNAFLRLMMDRYPPLPEHVPNPTDRIDPTSGRVVYPDLTFEDAKDKGFDVSSCGTLYGKYQGFQFHVKGSIKP